LEPVIVDKQSESVPPNWTCAAWSAVAAGALAVVLGCLALLPQSTSPEVSRDTLVVLPERETSVVAPQLLPARRAAHSSLALWLRSGEGSATQLTLPDVRFSADHIAPDDGASDALALVADMLREHPWSRATIHIRAAGLSNELARQRGDHLRLILHKHGLPIDRVSVALNPDPTSDAVALRILRRSRATRGHSFGSNP
jgi:hypothetical protein